MWTTQPAGAPRSVRCVSMRPDVQPAVGLVPEWIALITRWPAPSWKTLAVLVDIDSTSPVPQLPAGQPGIAGTGVVQPVGGC